MKLPLRPPGERVADMSKEALIGEGCIKMLLRLAPVLPTLLAGSIGNLQGRNRQFHPKCYQRTYL